MLFVLPAVLFVGAILIALWLAFFRVTLIHERTVRNARRREVDFERLLAKPNEPLYCVACQELFLGPLDPNGCPKCQVRAFVIPARASTEPALQERVRQFVVACAIQQKGEETAVNAPVITPETTPSAPTIVPQGKILK
jgi:hypothetical protein